VHRLGVSVPVLRKIRVRHFSIRSSTAGFLLMMARRSAREIAPIIAVGIASSSRTRRGNHHRCQESLRLAAQQRCCSRYTQGNWRVPCAQLVAQPAQLRLLLLRFVHHFHDSRLPRIFR